MGMREGVSLKQQEKVIDELKDKKDDNNSRIPAPSKKDGHGPSPPTLGVLDLRRLEKKGCLTSSFTDPSPTRGGKSKRVFKLTAKGIEALEEVRRVQASVWAGIEELSARR